MICPQRCDHPSSRLKFRSTPVLAVDSDSLWERFCTLFGLDPKKKSFLTNADRVGNREVLTSLIEQAFASQDTADLLVALDRVGIPAGRVRTIDEVYEWEQTRSQGLLIDVDHPTLGRISLPGPPLRFFAHNGDEVTRHDHQAPPLLGQHNEALEDWLTRLMTESNKPSLI